MSLGIVSWWRGEGDTTDNWGLNNGSTRSIFANGKVGIGFASGFIVPDSPSLRLTNALSIEAWVNPSNVLVQIPQTIVSKSENNTLSTNGSYFLGIQANGLLAFSLSPNGVARSNTTLYAPMPLPTNQWSHVAATYDGLVMRLFVNATNVAQTNYSKGIYPSTIPLGVGTSTNYSPPIITTPWIWRGFLDEVTIYNRALSESEIDSIYDADSSGKCLVPPSIIVQPQSQGVPLGEDVRLDVTLTGSRPFIYQWRFAGTNSASSSPIARATNAYLVLEKFSTPQVGKYSVVVTNSAGQAGSASASLTLLPKPSCIEPPDGLISWWPADNSTADEMGTNNGAEYNGTFVPGKSSGAFSFNGTSTSLTVPYSPSSSFLTNTEFSIEGWIKASSTNVLIIGGSNMAIVSKRDGILQGVGSGYELTLNNGQLACWLGAPKATAPSFISQSADLRDSMFHHVAMSINLLLTNGGNLYVDGQNVLSFDPTLRTNIYNRINMRIGYPSSGIIFGTGQAPFNGLIDELAIYRRALSAAEILALRQAGSPGKCKIAPTIVSNPAGRRVAIGSNVTFTVTAAGSPKLRYQWLHNFQIISNATNSTYTTEPATFATGGNYAVRVTNLFGATTSSNVALLVDRPPVAISQAISLDEDTSTNIILTGSDAESDPLSFRITTPPAHGILLGNPPALTYQPAANYNGADQFGFIINDGFADSTESFIAITVRPVNDAPVALPQFLSVNEDTPLNILLTGTDVDGDGLSYAIVVPPSHGTLSGTAPNFTYLPATNYYGSDSFTFKANDGLLDSMPAAISITVLPVNDAPVAVAKISPLFIDSADPTNLLVLSLNNTYAAAALDASSSSDVEQDPMTYTWLEGTNLLAVGVLSTNLFNVGSHTITLNVSDGQAVSTTTLNFEVITSGAASTELFLEVQQSSLSSQRQQPLLASLRAAVAAFERGNFGSALNQLQAFQSKVQKQIALEDPTTAASWIAAAQAIIDSFSP